MTDWKFVAAAAIVMGYNAIIICGTAYVVFWRDASGWWFLLTAFLLHDVEIRKAKP